MSARILAITAFVLFIAGSLWAGGKEQAIFLRGDYPTAGLISDSAGNLYGTTNFGGKYVNNGVSGTVFELSFGANGAVTQKILYNFSGGNDGGYPYASLAFDKQGNLYGTTANGGNPACQNGCGLVFELTPNGDGTWSETVIHAFNGNDGGEPLGPVSFDSQGNLYGTTSSYGYPGNNCWGSCGYIFELQAQSGGGWSFQNIYAFQGNDDAGNPQSQLIFDQQGNIYGTAGSAVIFPEVVFELTPANGNWTFHLLQSFPGCAQCDTFGVISGVTFDTAGNLYGTVPVTGQYQAGFLYKLTPAQGSWNLTVLHEFTNGNDGGFPYAAPVFDSAGNLYGTTSGGGYKGSSNCSGPGCGVVYKLTPNSSGGRTSSILHHFRGGNDGGSPEAPVFVDSSGNVYGTTYYGGPRGYGVAFEINP